MIVIATVVKRATADGLVAMKDEIPIGKTYRVDLNSRRVVKFWNRKKRKFHRKEIIDTWPFEGYLPTELLEFGRTLSMFLRRTLDGFDLDPSNRRS